MTTGHSLAGCLLELGQLDEAEELLLDSEDQLRQLGHDDQSPRVQAVLRRLLAVDERREHGGR